MVGPIDVNVQMEEGDLIGWFLREGLFQRACSDRDRQTGELLVDASYLEKFLGDALVDLPLPGLRVTPGAIVFRDLGEPSEGIEASDASFVRSCEIRKHGERRAFANAAFDDVTRYITDSILVEYPNEI